VFVIRKLKTLILVAVLTLSFLSVLPGAVQAAIAVALDTTNQVINAATIYTTSPNTQDQVLSDVLASEQTILPKASGFLNSSVLKGQDGTKVVTLNQWKDLSSFQAYEAKQTPDTTISAANPRTFVFEIKQTETRSNTPAIAEHGAIMFSEFKMKDPDKQSELEEIVSQMMPGVMQMIPGLQWAAMAPSTDKTTISLIAQWNSREDFESLGKNPGFDKETNYWQAYADNEHDLFDVVKIIR
jgi:heme-degrading monooxygenase HmoA